MGDLRQFLFFASIVIALAGCSDADQESAAEELAFNVVDSLLGPVCAIKSSGLSFRPPANCLLAPDSIQTAIRQRLSLGVSDGQAMEFQECYADLERMTGVIVSYIPGIDNSADTGKFFADYRQALARRFGDEQIMEGDYSVGGVRVKSFLVTTPQMVQFKLICFGTGSSAAELSFFSVANAYEGFIRCIESSIGSIKLMEGGEVS